MPLHTYVATFPDWIESLPSELRGKVNPHDGAFEALPNRQHVWRKALTVGEDDVVVFAV